MYNYVLFRFQFLEYFMQHSKVRITRERPCFTQVSHQSKTSSTAYCHLRNSGERNGVLRRTKVSFGNRWSCYGWQKGMSQDKATLNSAKIRPIALSVINTSYTCLLALTSKWVSNSVSQSVKKNFFKFCSNFCEWVGNDLKTLLCLAIPNQYWQTVKDFRLQLLGE